MNTRHAGFIFVLMAAILFAGCIRRGESQPMGSATHTKQTLTVFAAASLAEAFDEIAEAFEANHPSLEVVLNFAGSQQLARQISLGAPADVFASANPFQMQQAIQSGRIAHSAPLTFARNHLVVVLPPTNPSAIETLDDLANKELTLVIADGVVPAGQYTREFLQQASGAIATDYESLVLANVASYEQSVRAVLTKVSLGEADAGIVYKSDIFNTSNVLPLLIPDSLNATARYPIAALSDSPKKSAAQAFVTFVHAPAAQAILQAHGFKPPTDK